MNDPPTKTEDAAPDQESSDATLRRSLFHRLQRYGYRKFPSLVPDPNRHEILSVARRRDDEENAKTEPATDELIDLRCVWAVEFYTPSQISHLLHGFERPGWNIEDPMDT